jgi:hypothetical protein
MQNTSQRIENLFSTNESIISYYEKDLNNSFAKNCFKYLVRFIMLYIIE